MPANSILICAPSETLRASVEQGLNAKNFTTVAAATPAEAVTIMRSLPIDLIVAEGLAVSGAIAMLRTASQREVTPILVVAPAHDVEARIAFLEAGADDVLPGGFTHNELEARVMALLIRSGHISPEASRQFSTGQLITFFSPKGGVGTTTLAVNTGVLLAGGGQPATAGAATAAGRALLIDLDLQFGQVATHLNLSPRFDLAGLVSDPPALADAELAASYLTEHASGLTVLAAPTNPEADFRITHDQLQQVVEIYRPSFDQIIFDLGSRLDPRTLWVLEQADTHVFVLFPELAALRAMSILLGFLTETAALRARTHFVVNHIFSKELLKTRDIENLLRARPAAEIPYTEVEMIRAVNEGVPLVMAHPTSPAAAAMRQLAQAVIGIDTTHAAPEKHGRRSLFHRR